MGYRKFTAGNVFTGYEMLGKGHVLVCDADGKVKDIVPPEDAGGDVEKFEGILAPGLINCHCHLELSHMKGVIPPGTGMVKFLLTVLGTRDQPVENILEAIALAEQEMTGNGIVATGDICNTPHTIVQKQNQNIRYHNFIETIGVAGPAAGARFALSLELLQEFQPGVSIVPHAPYSVSNDLMALINGHDANSLLTIHNQESPAENELFQHGTGDFLELYRAIGAAVPDSIRTGTTSLRSFLGRISPGHSMLLVHDTVTAKEDIDWIKTYSASLPEIYWCVCPNANLYINNMLADVPLLAASGYKMVLGTDSLASNHRLDIVAEIRTLQRHFPNIPITEMLRWATIYGANALRIDDQFGSFEKGKSPGVVLITGLENHINESAHARRIL